MGASDSDEVDIRDSRGHQLAGTWPGAPMKLLSSLPDQSSPESELDHNPRELISFFFKKQIRVRETSETREPSDPLLPMFFTDENALGFPESATHTEEPAPHFGSALSHSRSS